MCILASGSFAGDKRLFLIKDPFTNASLRSDEMSSKSDRKSAIVHTIRDGVMDRNSVHVMLIRTPAVVALTPSAKEGLMEIVKQATIPVSQISSDSRMANS